jgi:cytosine/adenosine deaminase-related metal-dependent hydrolase
VLCYGATERNGGRDEAAKGLGECRRFIRTNRRPLVRGVVGLHASFTVSDETVREAGNLCRELDTVLHVHVAEDRADVEDAARRGFAGPLERLEALDALPPGSILAHGVHLDAAQVRRASSLGCWIVQNPRSNRHNGVGYPAALAESAGVALGTDGFVSDMREEATVLLEEAAAHHEDTAAVTRRLGAGAALAAERFGAAALEVPPVDVDRVRGVIADIREEAREAAAVLWARMESLM